MLLYLLMMGVDVLLAVHCYRTGRQMFWIFIILFFPGIGALVYFIAEILPELVRGSAGKTAKKHAGRILDPNKEYRAAKDAFAIAPTVANRIRLAQSLMERRDYDGVIALVEPGLSNQFAEDPLLLEGLAFAHFHKREYPQALEFVQRIYAHQEWPPKDYIKLLRARLYNATGNPEAALEELGTLVKSFPGEEARVVLAQLYEQRGAKDEARKIYEDVLTRAQRAPKHYRDQQKEWIGAANTGMKKLG